MRKFDVLNFASIPGKHIKEIKNITWVMAISELPFHLFFYRYRCACLDELATAVSYTHLTLPTNREV